MRKASDTSRSRTAASASRPPRADGRTHASAAAREAAELLFELLMAQKRVSQAVARDFGLTLQQLAALRSLDLGRGVPMSALAEALSCDAANITSVVDKLEARGLARRSASADRRVRLIELTAQGHGLREEIMLRLHQPTPWITVLSPEDQRLLRDLLKKGLAGSRSRRRASSP